MKGNHFDTLVWNELRKELIRDVGYIREDLELFEKLNYSKGSMNRNIRNWSDEIYRKSMICSI
jgi:hypothetical protein